MVPDERVRLAAIDSKAQGFATVCIIGVQLRSNVVPLVVNTDCFCALSLNTRGRFLRAICTNALGRTAGGADTFRIGGLSRS